MNQSAHRGRGDKAQKPEDKQDDCDGFEHGVSPVAAATRRWARLDYLEGVTMTVVSPPAPELPFAPVRPDDPLSPVAPVPPVAPVCPV